MKTLPALMGGALALLSPDARAGVQGWLDFGPETPGESTDAGHVGWASVERLSSSHEGGGAEMVFHRTTDKASPKLMEACAKGKHFTEVKLDVAKTVQGQPVDYWEITLQDVLVSSYSGMPGTGGGTGEKLTLKWKSLVFTYRVFPASAPPYATTTIVSPDTDGDGLPDAYEQSVGLASGVSNLRADTDGDGVPDTVEYRLGTHPANSTSFFSAVATPTAPNGGELRLSWPSVPGEDYQIEQSPDLGTAFSPFATITATSAETTYTVPRTSQAGFFRVSKNLP
ncbi:type VI secretion system tube protein Hcp [Luteolibacter yonseiensis]|uniref:Type VI secretion system tube protein Hcp n=1 Tax=Luteolibacter yonseiensis TaxID=1144680 RepID=A0A934R3M8_9BACT|nr:type VI secretion system tube protein Hcp [Luteolibacter yonseiensis]MBK1815837.1 type VI secretion system tube protein Hcp [Luteolibacter yonseiensis]